MHRTLPYISLFVVTVLLQVFLFDNLSISIYLNPLVYVAFVALLPLDTPPVVLLASGLAMGGRCIPVTISAKAASPAPGGSDGAYS